MDTDMALSCSLGLDVTMAQTEAGTHISLFLTTFVSSALLNEPICFSFPVLHHVFAPHNRVCLPAQHLVVPDGPGEVFSPRSAVRTQAGQNKLSLI